MSGADRNASGKRKRNNIFLGLVLFSFVGLVFAITVAKMVTGPKTEQVQ
jgi:uncharacterized protein involved in exopolysaccharide biosynthesis